MMSLSGDKKADIIGALNTTSSLLWQYGKSNIPFRAPT